MWSYEKIVSVFIMIVLFMRGVFWISDGKRGNRRSMLLGVAAIMVGVVMFIFYNGWLG